ncbi:unnamed protein product [Trichobilharzia szidati]|nr:unnamed protein product [Trichobilharzia szidati]
MLKWSKEKKEEQPSDWPKYAEHLEHCVEDVRRVASETHRGLVQHVLISKKNKKYPEQSLSTVLKEAVDKSNADDRLFVIFNTGVLLNCVTREASKALSILASYHREHENRVERQVADPLNRLAEETCVNISKDKRSLQKCLTEVRSARGQLQKTMQCIQTNTTLGYPGSSNPSVTIDAVNRIGQAQHQLEEKESELESSKEQLLRDLYTFAADEESHSHLILEYFQLQESYLSESLQLVQKVVADLSQTIRQQKRLTTFGRHLPDHLSETKRSIAYVLDVCISYLDQESVMQEEGLFRKSGSQKRTDLLVKALNIMQIDEHLLRKCDSAVVAGALKQYLLSLPEPLITYEFADQWAAASKKQSPTPANIQLIHSCLEKMPADFRLNLGYLMCFLSRLSNQSNVNKMTSDNLSIVIAPNMYRLSSGATNTGSSVNGNLTRSNEDVGKSLDFLQNNRPAIHLVDILIQNAEQLFGQEQACFRLTHVPSHLVPKMYLSRSSLPSTKLNSSITSSHGLENTNSLNEQSSLNSSNSSSVQKRPAVPDRGDVTLPNSHLNASTMSSRMSLPGSTPVLQRKKNAAPKPPVPTYPANCAFIPVSNIVPKVNQVDSQKSDTSVVLESENTNSTDPIAEAPTHGENPPQPKDNAGNSTGLPSTEIKNTDSNCHNSLLQPTTPPASIANECKISKEPPKRPPPPDVNSKQNNAGPDSETENITVM